MNRFLIARMRMYAGMSARAPLTPFSPAAGRAVIGSSTWAR
jgi:hypothetical protein